MTVPADRHDETARARAIREELTTDGTAPLSGLVARLAARPERPVTLLCVCPVSRAVLRAAVAVAHAADFPLVLAATRNQVSPGGGYTGLDPAGLHGEVTTEAAAAGLDVPVFVGLDHGGPWTRDGEQALDPDAAMDAARGAVEACLDAGYAHLHIDATRDPGHPGARAAPADIVARTVALLRHAETYRAHRALPPVSYEVSAEEEHGRHGAPEAVTAFVSALEARLQQETPALPLPLFTVANLGTDLHTHAFDARRAQQLARRLQPSGTFLKGHFTDFVRDLEQYPRAGVVAANVGPELAAIEYRQLRALSTMARARGHDIAFEAAIVALLEEAGTWRKWLREGESASRLADLARVRQVQILETASRYVLSSPRVEQIRTALAAAFRDELDVAAHVHAALCETLHHYAQAFGLPGLGAWLLGDS